MTDNTKETRSLYKKDGMVDTAEYNSGGYHGYRD